MSLPRWMPRLVVFIFVALLVVGAVLPSYFTPAQAQTPGNYFPETGHLLRGSFGDYWRNHGGLALQGYPITEEFIEMNKLDGRPYTVQYFERAIFELHPENKPPYDVLLTQLGTFRYQQKYPKGAPNQARNPNNPRVFKETGHSIGGSFRPYWESHGGLAQLGYPLSDEFPEKSDLDGKTYTVQYFERAVLEWHPENKAPYNILLSQLGKFELDSRYPNNRNPAADRVNSPAPATGAGAVSVALPIPAICDDVPGDTSFCLSSPPGDTPEAGQNFVWTPKDALFNAYYGDHHWAGEDRASLNMMANGEGTWSFEFRSPVGEEFTTKLYEIASQGDSLVNDPKSPTIMVNHMGGGPCYPSGRFQVLDLDVTYDLTGTHWSVVNHAAVIFDLRCRYGPASGDATLLRGILRLHSNAGRTNAPPLPPTATPAPVPLSAGCRNTPGDTFFCLEAQGFTFSDGKSIHAYTSNDVVISASKDADFVGVSIVGDNQMALRFNAPANQDIAIGRYDNVKLSDYGSPVRAYMDLSGLGDLCSTAGGQFEILDLPPGHHEEDVQHLAVNFVVLCEDSTQRIMGSLRLHSNAGRTGAPPPLPPPPTPVPPQPSRFCQNPPGVSAGVSYVCLESPTGDHAGGGHNWVGVAPQALFNAYVNDTYVQIEAVDSSTGSPRWTLQFTPPQGKALAPGFYDRARHPNYRSPLRPGLIITSDGDYCFQATGRFQVLDFAYDKATNRVTRFSANFEQRCYPDDPPLLGTIRYSTPTH